MGGDIMIDVILILAIITGLTIVAVRYGRRLLVLTGMALTRAFEETADRKKNFGDDLLERMRFELDDLINAPALGNANHHHYEEFRRELHSETG